MKKRVVLLLAAMALCLVASPAIASARTVTAPDTSKSSYKPNATVKVQSFTKPQLSDDGISHRAMYFYFYRKSTETGNYVYKFRIKGSLYNSSFSDTRTTSKASTSRISKEGHWRVRAKLIRLNSDGDADNTTTSGYTKFTVKSSSDAAKADFVSAPTTKYSHYNDGQKFTIKSYLKPKFESSTSHDKSITYRVWRKNQFGDWVFKFSVDGKIYKSDDFSSRSLCKATGVQINTGGKYRIVAVYRWTDSDGVHRGQKSEPSDTITIED